MLSFYLFTFIFWKESLVQQQQNGAAEWSVLSQGSRELEGLLKLVSKERLQLERHFVLATQVLRNSIAYIKNHFNMWTCDGGSGSDDDVHSKLTSAIVEVR